MPPSDQSASAPPFQFVSCIRRICSPRHNRTHDAPTHLHVPLLYVIHQPLHLRLQLLGPHEVLLGQGVLGGAVAVLLLPSLPLPLALLLVTGGLIASALLTGGPQSLLGD